MRNKITDYFTTILSTIIVLMIKLILPIFMFIFVSILKAKGLTDAQIVDKVSNMIPDRITTDMESAFAVIKTQVIYKVNNSLR